MSPTNRRDHHRSVAKDLASFGDTAKSLARNPLGIIALFIVMVYGFAALVTAFASSLSAAERMPLIWFLVLFPVLVLVVFAWLVSRHGGKLYGPADYRDEENYIRMQLRHLETKVEAAGTENTLQIARLRDTAPLNEAQGDARLTIAQMRLDIEKELFLLTRYTPKVSGDTNAWPLRQHIDELERVNALEPEFANSVREFVPISDRLVHDTSFTGKDARSAASVGGALLAKLHHLRLVAALARDFEAHLLWHSRRREAGDAGKYYFWSAVAATLPDFDYDFDVYDEAARRYVDRLRPDHPRDADTFHILSLEEFVAVLKFRERELQRIMKTWSSKGWQDGHEIEWQWPSEWGNLGWNGPILRERVHLWGAEEELMRTRMALDFYTRRLAGRAESRS